MKHNKFYFLLSLLLINTVVYSQNNDIIEIPLTTVNGFGPFHSSMGGMGYDEDDESNPWRNTYKDVKGIPTDWTDVKKGHETIDIYQLVYQEYHRGNIAREFYEQLQKSWEWTPDTTELTKQPLKTTVSYITGIAPDGIMKMMVDRNNNGDLSDDEAFIIPKSEFDNESEKVVMDNLFYISYERLLNGEVVTEKIPMAVVDLNYHSILFSAFPQYKKGTFDGYDVLAHSGFSNLNYSRTSLAVLNGEIEGKIPYDSTLGKGEYVEMNGKLYKYLGVNKNRDVVMLERINQPANELASTQIGFRAFDFEGEDFKTKENISLNGLNGKYVYLDFWAVWCGPCVQELPELKSLYEKLDTSKMQILSVVGSSPADALETMIEKHGITWPQIFSDDGNNITGLYGIGGFPTTFLIDPEGIIIAKNLRSKELGDKIKELGLMNE